MDIKIKKSELGHAWEQGALVYLQTIADAIYAAIGGELNAKTMGSLNSEQITLLAYLDVRDEVMDGGFVELIHNGYGPFIFRNPFDKALVNWGLTELSQMIKKCRRLYYQHYEGIEADCDDDAFQALYEQYPEFDDFDDDFVEREEAFTGGVAAYVKAHIENFCKVEDE